jgi:methylmalonyl-CoA mutase N-terminal domain/subunit
MVTATARARRSAPGPEVILATDTREDTVNDADRRAQARADYERLVTEATREAKERKDRFETASGIERRRLYTGEDVRDELETLGVPGAPPYTRGVQATMYRGRHWTMRQYAGFGSPAETNARFKKLLEEGQTGLSVAFDLPTQIGYDSDDALALGEVGKVGVPISSIHDMEALLADLPLDKVSISMTINSSAIVLLAYLVAVAKRRGLDPSKLSGTTQNDILKEYIARGTFRFPIAPSMRLVTDTFRFSARSLPKWNPISISGYHMREAGATAVQELAFTLANAIAYVEAATKAGLAPDAFMPRLSFFFACHSDFLEEVAKFRVARRLWAKIASEKLGAKDERSRKCRFHVQTGGVTLTGRQIDVNVVRVTLQALAAVLGGCQSLHTNSKDEALALPTENAAVLALRTQQVIAYETGLADTVDPLGGSFALEALTDELEGRCLELLAKIDRQGGMVRSIESGFPQETIRGAAYDHQKRVEAGERVIVGVNKFTQTEHAKPAVFRVDERAQAERVKALAELRRRRDGAKVKVLLSTLEDAARSPAQPLVEPIVAAVEGECTTGEVMRTLARVFGEYEDADAY